MFLLKTDLPFLPPCSISWISRKDRKSRMSHRRFDYILIPGQRLLICIMCALIERSTPMTLQRLASLNEKKKTTLLQMYCFVMVSYCFVCICFSSNRFHKAWALPLFLFFSFFWGKESNLSWKAADQEDGRLMSQNNHIIRVWMPDSFTEERGREVGK